MPVDPQDHEDERRTRIEQQLEALKRRHQELTELTKEV
ncbi:MAG: hypothetical protein V7647_2067, partial [Acidobacteriota bacterium]